MDGISQLNKNMEELASLFETRMQEFDNVLAGTQSSSKSSGTCSSPDISTLVSEFTVFRELIWKTLATLRQQLQLLTTGLDVIEMRSRRKVLLFHGVPEASVEQVEGSVCNVIRDRLKLSQIDGSNLDICHRIGVKKDKPRPILARFNTLKLKNMVWDSKKLLKGSGITISEFLTKPRQELFVTGRKHFGMKNCWTADGDVIISLPDKSRLKIVSKTELDSLISKFPQTCCPHDPKPQSVRARRAIKAPTK